MPTMNGFAGKLNKQLGSAGTSGGAAFSKAFGGKAVGAAGGIVSKFKSAGTSAGAQMGAAVGAALSAKGAAIAGVAGGIASAAAQKITAALSSLTGEITNASDSAQKFASTLGFGGVDTSTIDALTASTQDYADKTIYDLGDIRNTTAQLAANGVSDYAQLSEAAGNLNAVAGGNAATFKSVGMVLTQTAGAGKLTTENWNQLADAIPGASGKLQEAMKANGAYTGNFRDAMEKGEISAEEFNQAIMQLGMTDVAKEAATSTATFEGAMGNLEASAVTAGAKVLDAFKPLLTGGMASAGEAIDGIGDSVADFLSKCQDNGAIQALSDDVSLLGGAALDVMGAVGSLVGAVLGIEPGADGAADAADSFKGALDAAHPAIQGVADAASWLRDNAAKAAPAVRALAAGFVLMKAASAVAGAVKSLSGTLTAVSTLSTFAAGGLTAMAGGETAAGTAASLSAGQVREWRSRRRASSSWRRPRCRSPLPGRARRSPCSAWWQRWRRSRSGPRPWGPRSRRERSACSRSARLCSWSARESRSPPEESHRSRRCCRSCRHTARPPRSASQRSARGCSCSGPPRAWRRSRSA